jgi:hypothetical protein
MMGGDGPVLEERPTPYRKIEGHHNDKPNKDVHCNRFHYAIVAQICPETYQKTINCMDR